MNTIKKILSGLLITGGAVFLFVAASVVLTPAEERTDWEIDAAIGCIILGLPPVVAGSWLGLSTYRQTKTQKRAQEDLRSTFFRLLEQNQGQITVLRLAMEAQIPAEQAKEFLDRNAQDFNATFETDENGGIVYLFSL
ncbi:hypothetical protein IQ249_09895 [Lusitaniella coriacea LEGE 07157]|uniref:Uncharacterized protein n=1 Tax=Lusitaniella coriacea LEGE 07157 TaxID=945747 RepID=A0A8J7ISJ3_9CYAN|nr:hypothetical protein [Lusitaniella coriacea]MBE9116207.1 hypothetical protein [Lusitaniella coriacea LEGE 07157]